MRRGIISRIKNSVFWIKITHWEFWPFTIVYIPIYFYWIWLSIRARSFFFFSASNPGIQYGGMLGESKYQIFRIIPEQFIPKTLLLDKNSSFEHIKKLMHQNSLDYPVILKPDIGERGWMVNKISNDEELQKYLNKIQVDFLVQEYIQLPIELGIFYYRYPSENKGRITSIVRKKMLEVIGTGNDTVRELIQSDPRARIQQSTLEKESDNLLDKIPSHGEKIEVMPIGNHCRGTTFLNGNALINDSLNECIDQLSHQIEGFYFGRFDIRCASEDALNDGDFKILELNGAGAEPGHIYHPGFSLISAYKTIISHLNALLGISRENKKRGYHYMSFKEGLEFIREVRRYNKLKSERP